MITRITRTLRGSTSPGSSPATGRGFCYQGLVPSQTPQPPPSEEPLEKRELEQLAPPRAVLELMGEHLRGTHDFKSFVINRDLYLGGPRPPSQCLTWNPVKAVFTCDLCPGLVFSPGVITPERIAHAQRFDLALQPHLSGITDPEERDEMTRRFIDGSLNRERLRSLRTSGAKRRAAASSRPEVAERRRRVQEWLLERYAKLGVFEHVLDAAMDLQNDDLDSWLHIAHLRLERATIRRYWYDIDAPERKRALESFELRTKKGSRN